MYSLSVAQYSAMLSKHPAYRHQPLIKRDTHQTILRAVQTSVCITIYDPDRGIYAADPAYRSRVNLEEFSGTFEGGEARTGSENLLHPFLAAVMVLAMTAMAGSALAMRPKAAARSGAELIYWMKMLLQCSILKSQDCPAAHVC